MKATEKEITQRLQKALREQPCFGTVAEERIREAETTLGVSFPRSYRVFLKSFGASYGLAGCVLSGLPLTRRWDSAPPEFSNVIDDTELARKACGEHLPHEYVAISSDGCDCQFYLDTSRTDATEECLVIALGPGRDTDVAAASFLEFVEKLASGVDP
ncbi:MAG: SMI1/KNR4 family protein [Desulfobacteraceae bacterium]|jgi:hypothetical protein